MHGEAASPAVACLDRETLLSALPSLDLTHAAVGNSQMLIMKNALDDSAIGDDTIGIGHCALTVAVDLSSGKYNSRVWSATKRQGSVGSVADLVDQLRRHFQVRRTIMLIVFQPSSSVHTQI